MRIVNDRRPTLFGNDANIRPNNLHVVVRCKVKYKVPHVWIRFLQITRYKNWLVIAVRDGADVRSIFELAVIE